jgi:ectoine hydroxylase-related dioxygenase (phytanoyl-CoA dioxygenase family)
MRGHALRNITSEESDAFHRDGAVLIKRVLSADWVSAIEDGLETVVAKPDVLSESLGTLRVDQFPASRSPELMRFLDDSPIAEIVGTALRSPVRFYMDQSFVKPAGLFLPTQWHQDTCYYNIGGHDLIRAWVCCDPVPRNASLEIVRGSHLWNVTYSPLAGRDPEQDPSARAQLETADLNRPMLGRETYDDWTYWSGVKDKNLPQVPDIEEVKDSFDILGWDYEPGDVILFHGNVLHSALGNVESSIPRRAHASLWAGRDVHYLRRVGQIIPDPVALYDHDPRSGQLLSEFPDVFPLAWSPPDSEES